MIYEITVTENNGAPKIYAVEIARSSQGTEFTCRVNGEPITLDAISLEKDVLSLLLGGVSHEIRRDATQPVTHVVVDGRRFTVEVRDPRSLRNRRSREGSTDGPRKITAPMPGKVVRVLAPAGAEVEAGQGIIVIEAMKMQNELKSPKKGLVQKILAEEGVTVNAGDALAIVE